MVVRQPCQPPHTVLPATWSTVTRHTKTEQWKIIIILAGVMSVNSNSRVWHTSGPLVILTLYPSSDGCYQQENRPHHKAQIISNWFSELNSEFTVNGLHSHQTSFQQSTFGMQWNWNYHINMDENLWGSVSVHREIYRLIWIEVLSCSHFCSCTTHFITQCQLK